MKYALRLEDIVKADYLKNHIIDSLDRFFENVEDDMMEMYVVDGSGYHKILRINDIADDNAMLEFAIIGKDNGIIKLAFHGRMKG